MIAHGLTLALGLALLAQATPAPAPAQTPEQILAETNRVDPAFAEILEKSAGVMAGLKQFSVQAKVAVAQQADGKSSRSTSTQVIQAHRPGRFAVSANWAAFGEEAEHPVLRVASDGKQLTTYFIPAQLYTTYVGPDILTHLRGEPIIRSTLSQSGLDILVRPDMVEYVLNHTTEAASQGRETIDGVDTAKFRVVYGGQEIFMWIGPQDQPLLRRLASTTQQVVSEKETLGTESRCDLTWSLDLQLPDHAFELQPPPAATRVSNIFDTLMKDEGESPLQKPVPAVTLAGLDGKELALQSLRAKPTVLILWATWDGNPEETFKLLGRVREALVDQEVSLFAVNIGEEANHVKSQIEKVPGLPPILLDPDDRLARPLGVKNLPALVLINRDGVIVDLAQEIKPEQLLEKLRAIR